MTTLAPAAPTAITALRVLLAEDDAINQLLASRLLSKKGYSVVVADNGRRAVEAHRCRTLASCLDSPAINPLYVPGRRSTFRADCADVSAPLDWRARVAMHLVAA